ncbi:MAG TPA: hypothetical protein VK610_00120, partial [Rhodothermales bacterium]|nr:hypothetical protein [Rhodothermales bacterium]
MSLTDLRDQLQQQVTAQQELVLRSTLVPALDGALTSLLLTTLPLRTATVDLTDDVLVVTGSGDLLSLRDVSVEVRVTGDDGDAAAVTVTVPAHWSFADSFPGLPPSYKADDAHPGLPSLQPSLLYDLGLTDVTLTVKGGGGAAVGVTFEAQATLPAGYDHITTVLGLGATATLSGTLTLQSGGWPDVDLAFTVAGGTTLGVGSFHLKDAGLRIQTRRGTNGASDLTVLSCEADLLFGDGQGGGTPPTLHLAADYDLDNGAFRFTGEAPDPGLSLADGVGALAEVVGVDAATFTLPSPLDQLAHVYVQEVDVAVDTQDDTVSHLGFVVGTDLTWPIVPGFLEVTDLSTGWVFFSPFSGTSTFSATVSGSLAFGSADPKTYFDVTAHRDSGFSVTGELREGSTIDLAALVASALGVQPGLPAFAIDSLEVEASTSGDFRLQGSVASDWGITIDHRIFSLEQITFDLQKDGDTKTGQLYGQFDLAGSRLYVRAAFDAASGTPTGFDFEGGTLPTGDPISLTGVVSALLELFGASLPSSAPDITLKNLDVAFNTATKVFKFKGETDTEIEVPFLSGDDAQIHATVDLTSSVDSATGNRQLTGLMEGDLTIGSSVFKLQYTLGQASHVMTASWTSTSDSDLLGFDTLIGALGLSDDVEIPHDLDLNLKQVYFEYQVETGTLKLVADSATYGEAFFITSNFSLDDPTAGGDPQPASGTGRGYVFGLAFDASKISQVPVLGSGLEDADVFHFEELGLVISSADFKGFTVPQLPALPAVGGDGAPSTVPAPRKPIAADTTLKLQKGISIVGVVDLDSSDSSGQMDALKKVSPQSRLTVTAAWAASQNTFTLQAVLDGSVTIADGFTLGNAGLAFIFADGVTFQVYGDLGLMLDHRRIDVTPRLAISMEEVEFEVNV